MGIENFMTNLIDTFPSVINNKKPKDIHTLCIDLNGILHKICYRCNDKVKFKKSLISTLFRLIKKTKPSFIAIFIDGQAMLAKANTQIKRRDKYLYSKSSGISPLNLTPGTPFMDFIDETINEFLSNLDIGTFFSSSKVNNEGEIKMFEWLLNNNINERICIVGNDSDIIVLALVNRPLLNLYFYNDDNYMSLFKIVENLSNLISIKFSYNWHPVRMDFVLLSLFQGNDYLCRISNFKKLFESYKVISKKGFLLKKDGSFNLKNIRKLLNLIDCSSDIEEYDSETVEEYFKSLQWNFNLYQGKINNRYLPISSINLSSIIKHFPKELSPFTKNVNWLKPEAYTLLLMPITGKDFLPNNLKQYMEEDSIIKDLFPEPCIECIQWKQKLKELIEPEDKSSPEFAKYKNQLRKTNAAYSNHLKSFHSAKELPIERLESIQY
mgnify:CR=1 FL=1